VHAKAPATPSSGVVVQAHPEPARIALAGGHTNRVRILVDHSGYDLLNLGDIAQLQVCVRRLTQLWPNASIGVIANDSDRLREHCPGASLVDSRVSRSALAKHLPGRIRSGLVQVHKMMAPSAPWHRRSKGHASDTAWPPHVDLLQAVREADLVIVSGGGNINDTFWWHGSGVLSVVSLAQRLGTPTALFGQGIGPLSNRLLRRQLRSVAREVKVVGVREGVMSPGVLERAGVVGERVTVTGDDALEIATPAAVPTTGTGVGLNIRIAAYTGLDSSVARTVRETVIAAAEVRDAPLIALPVSRYQRSGEIDGQEDLAGTIGTNAANIEVCDIRTGEELAEAVRKCRVIVTSSYHAAVFGLANGATTLCLVANPYYDSKFAGLAELFPGACTVVRLDLSDLRERLGEAFDRAWSLDENVRHGAFASATEQVLRSRRLYEELRDAIGLGSSVTGTPAPLG